MTDYKLHANIFGKSCYNCSSCAADSEPENAHTTYWCGKEKRIIMKRLAVINSCCNEWNLKKD